MSVAGAVAGGARFAMAAAPDPETFWDEVRRYGATHVSYTWTSLHDVTVAPPNPNEQHHPIKLFMGSGMPRGLWRRVAERFAPARVLEFYASAEGEAILANLTGQPIGSMGRPLPGTPPVRIAAYDLRAREPGARRRTGWAARRAPTRSGCCWSARTRPTPRPRRRCAGCSSRATPGARPAICSCATSTASCGWSTR